jgi:superfamily II DNA or RNA helicase
MSPSDDRESLLRTIAESRRRLAEIDAERLELAAALSMMEARLAAGVSEPEVVSRSAQPEVLPSLSSAAKIALFRRLFRGRTDVFPRLWANSRTGKRGYSPACAHEWVRGVCEKPRVKCSECPNQAFLPVEDRVVLDHLLGHHVIGVYPLLSDETCWFLAIDLDKASWSDDVASLRETCSTLGLPVAVERSRSGTGAHVWFFFTAPVAASVARKLGCHLLTETMSRRHELSMGSYDRLFPNQDTMPKGGFGNLIALPFQDGPRQEGNTLFLDDALRPFADQWGYLATLPLIEPQQVERIAADAQSRGLVLGVRSVTHDDQGGPAPWDRQPSRRVRRPLAPSELPARLNVVLAQRIFVESAGVPPALLDQIKRLAAFQNPEFYKRQSFRLSTSLTPRMISCAEDLPQHVAIPRGCMTDLEDMLREYKVELVVEDRRFDGADLDVEFRGTLTPVQKRATADLRAHEQGVLVAPPGTGKTVVGIALIAGRARNTLVLVHRRPLMEQWITQLAVFLGLQPEDIGRIGAGKNKPTGRLDVAMLQSLVKGEDVADLVATYGHVVVDECHHVPAVSFERVMREVRARFVTGLTATPQRRDGHHPILEMQLGPVRHVVESRSQAGIDPFKRRLLVRETAYRPESGQDAPVIQELYRRLATDQQRNSQIVDDVIGTIEEGRSPIVLSERRAHVEFLAEQLARAVRHVVVLQGGMSEKLRVQVNQTLAAIPPSEERVILATGRYAGEGFDDPRLDTLFLALPVSWKGTLVQYAGRLHRHLPEKQEVRIYDYVDSGVVVLARMFERRLRGYRSMGYEREQAG